tara:strand:- start:398 stop:577 length:180 start_codon:yes stop_codon:yes gene_type:complete
MVLPDGINFEDAVDETYDHEFVEDHAEYDGDHDYENDKYCIMCGKIKEHLRDGICEMCE